MGTKWELIVLIMLYYPRWEVYCSIYSSLLHCVNCIDKNIGPETLISFLTILLMQEKEQ